MTIEKIEELLQQGEGIEVEFKTAQFDLNKDIFDSICAFLNRKGGHLLLGVKDNGKVEGVIESCIPDMINNLIICANNPTKLNPAFYFTPKVLDYDGKKIIHIYVPESSQVHSTGGRIFDRNGDGDLDITRHSALVTNLYMRKQTTYSENQVFPYFELADCNQELFRRIRMMAENKQMAAHPWTNMSDEEIIRSAGLYKTDPITGKSGLTLAAALLLGKDEIIQSVLPHHKTDALLRVENLDRYDDRDDIRTNLIDSFDRLMAFIAKHLPDKFYLEGVQRVSLRGKLFREIVSNLLIHREFANGFPAKLIIERDRVYTENWSLPHGMGRIDPLNFAPFPKNPVIAKFFKEIGRVDELGSGVRNVFRYSPEYTPGAVPELIEGDVFKTIVPLRANEVGKIMPTANWPEVRSKVRSKFGVKFGVSSEKILELILQDQRLSAVGIAEKIDLSPRAVEKQLARLKESGVIERVGPDKTGYWRIVLDD
jgi:ATP-dependent DNA helicase RecG